MTRTSMKPLWKVPAVWAGIKSPLILESELEVSCPPTQRGFPCLEFSFQHIQHKFGHEEVRGSHSVEKKSYIEKSPLISGVNH